MARVLVINAGSSSVKYYLYEMPQAQVLARGSVERIGEDQARLTHVFGQETFTNGVSAADVDEAVHLVLDTLVDGDRGVLEDIAEVSAVGHRVVHGGEEFTGSVIIDEHVIASVEKYADLAPLHNPPNLAGIRAVASRLPSVTQVACFDTAFHTTIPKVAYLYGLPYELYERYGIRRYGFHGISHRYVARRVAALMGRGKYDVNVITCHLGNGCSITAVKGGRSIDTSMGFTPLEGVPMGTRSGDLDPAILFYLADKGYDPQSLKTLCNKESGLLGISGLSNDIRNLLQLAAQGHERATLAIDVFCYRVRKYIGAYAAVLEPLDAIAFTGGIGENAVQLREQITRGMSQLGVQLDPAANARAVGEEARIEAPASSVKVCVVPTNEQLAIAKDTYELAARKHPAVSRG
ncbi:MAG: acetate kinase [Planctomycetes bacterium]|jgi:acetate kinase|nr:acetate kinase [Planctomycetota bacterium]